MPINNNFNFNFKSITDYFSAKGEGGANIRKTAADLSKSFSAVRNGSWYKKCAQFDPVKLAQRLNSHPNTQHAVNVAQQHLKELHGKMYAVIQELYAKLKQYGIYSSHQAHDGERAIHQKWRPFLPADAFILPGAQRNADTRVETITWARHGVKWTSVHDLNNGERTSTSDWMSRGNGWQCREQHDINRNRHWTIYHHDGPPLQHFKQSSWTSPDKEGWCYSSIYDYEKKTSWTTCSNPAKQLLLRSTDWSKPNAEGLASRVTYDEVKKAAWHDTFNPATGEYVSTSEWAPTDDGNGVERTVWNHNTNKKTTEFKFEVDSAASSAQQYAGQDLKQLTTAHLAELDLDGNVTDMDVIQKKYKQLAGIWHPDKQFGKTDLAKAEAAEKYKKIADAYTFLKNNIFSTQ